MLKKKVRRAWHILLGMDHAKDGVLQPARKRVRQFREHLEVGTRVLEIGVGSGAVSEVAIAKGAREIVAVDINPKAVAAARKRLPRATVLESDLFEKVEGRFDTIIFAAPWSEGEIKSVFYHAIFDHGVTPRFLAEAKKHLAEGGSIWVQYSDESGPNYRLFLDAIEKHGYRIEQSWAYRDWAIITKRHAAIILYKLRPNGSR